MPSAGHGPGRRYPWRRSTPTPVHTNAGPHQRRSTRAPATPVRPAPVDASAEDGSHICCGSNQACRQGGDRARIVRFVAGAARLDETGMESARSGAGNRPARPDPTRPEALGDPSRPAFAVLLAAPATNRPVLAGPATNRAVTDLHARTSPSGRARGGRPAGGRPGLVPLRPGRSDRPPGPRPGLTRRGQPGQPAPTTAGSGSAISRPAARQSSAKRACVSSSVDQRPGKQTARLNPRSWSAPSRSTRA